MPWLEIGLWTDVIMINHEWIKAEAEQLGCPVTDLLALARQNDPFYVGTPSSRTQAQWFANVWKEGGFSEGVHLRRLHYWCVSQGNLKLDNDKPYENTDRCWQYLCLASKAAPSTSMAPNQTATAIRATERKWGARIAIWVAKRRVATR